MRKRSSIYIGFFIVLISLIFFASYRTVKKFTGPRMYTEAKKEKKQHQRNELYARGGIRVSFVSSDGKKLFGILFLRPHAKRTLLIAHGYRMTKERLRIFPELFVHDNMLLFDIRTHGESLGDLVTFGYHEQEDIRAAAEFLSDTPGTSHTSLYGIGISMGAVALLGVAAEHPNLFKAIVIDSPFAKLENQLMRVFQEKTGLPRVPFSTIMQFLFEYLGDFSIRHVDASEYAKKITIPTMVIHAETDTFVPVDDAKLIYSRLPNKKELWLIPSGRHARIFKSISEEYKNRIEHFFYTAGQYHYPSK
jgi:uncharacterized protein